MADQRSSVRLVLARARVAIAQANVLSLELRSSAYDAAVVARQPLRTDSTEEAHAGQSGLSNSAPSHGQPSLPHHPLSTTGRTRADEALESCAGSRQEPSQQAHHGSPRASSSADAPESARMFCNASPQPPAARDCLRASADEAEGVASRLAVLKDQQDSTLRQLVVLRVQQLTLRKQQLSALHGLLVAQVHALGEAPVPTSAVRVPAACMHNTLTRSVAHTLLAILCTL